MERYHKNHYQNIKRIFTEKTGVELNTRRRRSLCRRVLLVTAMLLCIFTATVFAEELFSSLSGDDLSFAASYEGNGIVVIEVENRSQKELRFQSKLKLMRWSDGAEVLPLSDDLRFEGTHIGAGDTGSMRIDLSYAYDLTLLEEPLLDDHYYLVLTNRNYLFGQDWMCTIFFKEPIRASAAEAEPQTMEFTDESLLSQVQEELQPYFTQIMIDPEARKARNEAYLQAAEALQIPCENPVIAPISIPLLVDGPESDVIFDASIPAEQQHQLTGLHRKTQDLYGIPIGANLEDSALVLSAYLPQRPGDTDGGAELPLVYFLTYEKGSASNPESQTLIHGQLYTFADLAEYLVYEDDTIFCYDVTDLFYTDLRQYTETMVSQRGDVYFDEGVWQRVQNISSYYRDPEILKSRFYFRETVE